MKPALHLVMQGKGGVGKSVVSRLLVEYLIEKKLPYRAFDADPVNASLAAVSGFKVDVIELLTDAGQIAPRKFDDLMETLFDLKNTHVVIDTGASSFLPMMGYMEENGIVAALREEGYDVHLHSIITGGPSRKDTQDGFRALAERFAEDARTVLWANAYFGALTTNGPFLNSPYWTALNDAELVEGYIALEAMSELKQEDFADHLASNRPFADVISGKTKAQTMIRRRLKAVHAELMSLIDDALAKEDQLVEA